MQRLRDAKRKTVPVESKNSPQKKPTAAEKSAKFDGRLLGKLKIMSFPVKIIMVSHNFFPMVRVRNFLFLFQLLSRKILAPFEYVYRIAKFHTCSFFCRLPIHNMFLHFCQKRIDPPLPHRFFALLTSFSSLKGKRPQSKCSRCHFWLLSVTFHGDGVFFVRYPSKMGKPKISYFYQQIRWDVFFQGHHPFFCPRGSKQMSGSPRANKEWS